MGNNFQLEFVKTKTNKKISIGIFLLLIYILHYLFNYHNKYKITHFQTMEKTTTTIITRGNYWFQGHFQNQYLIKINNY